MPKTDRIIHWKTVTNEYGGREFEGGFLGKITDQNQNIVYAGPDAKHSLRADTNQEAQLRAKMICDAVNDHSKLTKLRNKVEKLVKDIQGGMVIQKFQGSDSVHLSVTRKKLGVFIASYYSMFGEDLRRV